MGKLKTPHKKKAMDGNTISKPKRSLRSKHKREKSKKQLLLKRNGQRRNAKTAQQKYTPKRKTKPFQPKQEA